MRNNFLSTIVFIFLLGCRSQMYSPESNSGQQLVFGEGGGFSGQVIEYTLLANGEISMKNSLTKEAKSLQRVNKKAVSELFSKASQLGLDTMNFNHPGNLYYFIRLNENNQTKEITWGRSDHPVPVVVQDFYQELLNYTKAGSKYV